MGVARAHNLLSRRVYSIYVEPEVRPDRTDSTGDATRFSGSLKGEFSRSRFPAFPFRSRFGWTRFYFLLSHLFYFLDHGL